MSATATGRAPARLSAEEQQRLMTLECVITKGKETFTQVSLALVEIHDRQLYRDEYQDFKSYCEQRWGFLRETGYKFVSSGRVIRESEANGLPSPTNHRQARCMGEARARGRTADRAGDRPIDLGTAVRLVDQQIIGHINTLEDLHASHPHAGKASSLLRLFKDLLLPFPPLPTKQASSGPSPSLRPRGLDDDDAAFD